MITHEIITTRLPHYSYQWGGYYDRKRKLPGISINASKDVYKNWLTTCGISIGDILVRNTMTHYQDSSLWMCHICVEIKDELPPYDRMQWEGANPKVFRLLQCESGTASAWDRWESCIDMNHLSTELYNAAVEPNIDKLRNHLDARGFTSVPINKAKPTVA